MAISSVKSCKMSCSATLTLQSEGVVHMHDHITLQLQLPYILQHISQAILLAKGMTHSNECTPITLQHYVIGYNGQPPHSLPNAF